jgi:hypothetical protein
MVDPTWGGPAFAMQHEQVRPLGWIQRQRPIEWMDGSDRSASDRRESVSADVFLSRSHWPCEGASCARDGSRVADPTWGGTLRGKVSSVD